MEKQPAATNSKFRRRLLSLILLFTGLFSLNAQTNIASIVEDVSIINTPGQNLYANTEIKFEAFFPNIDSSVIDFERPSDGKNYTIKGIRKITGNSNVYGTSIELWIEFDTQGSYKPSPLNVKINRKRYSIPFETIKISLNPQKQKPVMLVQFPNGTIISSTDASPTEPVISVHTGEQIKFTIKMQYALQLVQEKWDIPKNSLFNRTAVFEEPESKYHDKDTIGTIYPISEYVWTPLTEGKQNLPSIKLELTSYTGNKTETKLPPISVMVLPSENQQQNSSDSIFDDAFASPISSVEAPVEIQTINLTEEDCQKLADLRSQERHSLFGSAKKQRINFEKSLGLPSTQKEYKVPYFYVIIAFTVIFLILLIIFIIRRKLSIIITSGTVLVFLIILLINSISQITNKYAVSKGCTIQSIPEIQVESKSELPAGSRIKITAKSGGWIYVELGETCGWCYEDEVIFIN